MAKSNILDMQDVVGELDCPICMETFTPPIYICAAGHSICSGCRSKLLECPTCRNGFSKGRNYSLEKIISATQLRCQYFEQGCKRVIKGDSYPSHIKCCHYRELKCLCCDQTGIQYNAFLKHVVDKHQSLFTFPSSPSSSTFCLKYIINSNHLDPGASKAWRVACFKYSSDIIVFVQRQLKAGFLFFSLWKYPEDAVGLICNMKLRLGQGFKASWEMKVNSYRNTFAENSKYGAVAAISLGSVTYNTERNLVDQSYHFNVTYEIKEG